jgi:hypothetical protein
MEMLTEHYESLDRQAVRTLIGAKRAAASNENVWLLPSGKHIAVARGICVPPGSVMASRQVVPRVWRDFWLGDKC